MNIRTSLMLASGAFGAVMAMAGANFALADKADPTAFGGGTDVTRVYPGVTLTRADGTCDIYNEDIRSPLVLTSDIRDPVFSSGTWFTPESTGGGWGNACVEVLRVDFERPAHSVSVEFFPDDTDTGVFQAYDSDGNVLSESVKRSSTPFGLSYNDSEGRIAYALATFADSGNLGTVNFTLSDPFFTLAKSVVAGPLRPSGAGGLESFDLTGDGLADEGAIVGAGLGHQQHFTLELTIRAYSTVDLSAIAFTDVIPDGFALSSTGEAIADSGCTDGSCDGVIADTSGDCVVTISGPQARKGTIDPRYLVIEADSLTGGDSCTTTLFLETVVAQQGKGKNAATVYYPDSCTYAESADGSTVVLPVVVNPGVSAVDDASGEIVGDASEATLLQIAGGCP